jgi:hypothetical protein
MSDDLRSNQIWGSDPIAQMLRQLNIEYIALTPGASFRGCMTAWSISRQYAARNAALSA